MADGKKDSNELAEERTEFAEERTDWAEDRTVQATERTYAGWLRTAFAAIGIGLGFRAVFGALEPAWLPKAIATAMFLMAAFIAFSAQQRACGSLARLKSHDVKAPESLHMRWLSYLVTAAAITLSIAIWFLKG